MESRIGLDYIVENPDYTQKLAAALDTSNIIVKKQVFELLSALCVYNTEGYTRALDALEHYKKLKCERYRFQIVLLELENAQEVDYQTALLAFINCLIISTPQLKDRVRIRNEFIGLKLVPLLNELRRTGKSVHDLRVQLDVFDEQRESDEAQTVQSVAGVDINSHLDVFNAILHRVADTPQEIPFLSILQHLLSIDPKEAVSDIVWDTAERLVHRATLLESREDATRLLRSPSQTKLTAVLGSRKQSLTPAAPAPPPPPPAPPAPPPPPPISGAPPPPPPPPTMVGPPPPPGPPSPPMKVAPSSPEPPEPANPIILPQQETPTPRAKMKTINWNKIDNKKVTGNKHNIWAMVARNHQGSPMADLDWGEMEGLFCQQIPSAPTPTPSPKLHRDSPDSNRRKETAETSLLDAKRNLNVNIFLKQFRSSNEDIIQLIRNGEHDDFGAEKLGGLLKLLPEVDEVEMLRNFDGDKTKLGDAEKFLLLLMEVPNYKLRIESMRLKADFEANMSLLEPSINAMILAGEDLMKSEALREVLYMVVRVGNFLNAGRKLGNAAGVNLSSLRTLTDIKSNKPGMNLIHFVALQAEKKNKDLLKFPGGVFMTALEESTKTTMEQLRSDINNLDGQINRIKQQIDLPSTEKDIKDQMASFLKEAAEKMAGLQADMADLDAVRKKLAEFFCEDPNTFKLEECYKVFHGFSLKFRQAVIDNEKRRHNEEQAAARRRQREEQLAKKRPFGFQLTNGSESECYIVDSLLNDINSGLGQKGDLKGRKFGNGIMTSEEDVSLVGSPALTRRRLGSFSCDQQNSSREETYSPDVTPTGSLRRRRSRVPSEEDDSSLMDFLRSSGHDGTRERKSWGSLDRSWARPRGGRKRPDLLSADFLGERERPTSPSPSPIPSTPDEDTRPKPWKQSQRKADIEAWLNENEKDKQDEERRRRTKRFQNNRRSLEADSESEGRSGSALDTLPEGKLAEGSPMPYRRVYPDWRSPIDKTDVVGAMEAIAEAQPQSPVKDKSPWRKSTLNVPNTSEQTEMDVRRQRRLKSRGSLDVLPTPNLQSISEEEKRKEVIRSLGQNSLPEDSLPVYIRCPSETSGPEKEYIPGSPSVSNKFKGKISPMLARRVLQDINDRSPVDEQTLPPFPPRRPKKSEPIISDKVEIDSDNIETPPASRKLVGLNRVRQEEPDPMRCSRLKEEIKEEEEPLGQFDRFDRVRKTMRHRKNAEDDGRKPDSPPEVIPEKQTIKLETQQAQSVPVDRVSPSTEEVRLRKWQSKLTYKDPEEEALADINKTGEELKQLAHSSTLPRSFKAKAPLDTKDALDAIGKQLKESSVVDSPSKPQLSGISTLPRAHRRKTGFDHGTVTPPIKNHNEESHQPNSRSTISRIGIPKTDSRDNVNHRAENVSKTELIPEIRLNASSPVKLRAEPEILNDEGFEETQSLVSETPSQGASSGNYEGDFAESPKSKTGPKLLRADSSGSGDTSSGINVKQVQRSRSLRSTPATGDKKSVIPRRTGSLRKPEVQTPVRTPDKPRTLTPSSRAEPSPVQRRILTLVNKQNLKPAGLKSDSNIIQTPSRSTTPSTIKRTPSVNRENKSALKSSHCDLPNAKKKVERSSSRSSLRSSRSSLNSATSVSTVRNVNTPEIKTYTRAIKSLTSDLNKSDKKPLGIAQSKNRTPVPASRSSSSGSSIGPTVRRPKTSTVSTSFKENSSGAPASRSSSSGSSIGPAPTMKKSGLSFMRPTAASSAKDIPDSTRFRNTLRSIK